MAAGTGLISTFYTAARLAMIARQGMAIELGGVLFLFAGGLLARNSAGACRSRCTCAPGRCWRWFISACPSQRSQRPHSPHRPQRLHLPHLPYRPRPVTAARLPPLPPCRAQVKTAFAAALLSMVAFFAGIIMLPARLAGLGVDEAGTGYFPVLHLAGGGGRRGAAAGAGPSRQRPRRAGRRAAGLTRPPTAVSLWRSRPRNGRRWRAPCCMDWDSACRFRCSTTWSSNIAPTARGPVIWRTCPWPSSAASSCLPSWNSCPAARRRIRRRRPDFIAVGCRLRARDGPPAPLPRHD